MKIFELQFPRHSNFIGSVRLKTKNIRLATDKFFKLFGHDAIHCFELNTESVLDFDDKITFIYSTFYNDEGVRIKRKRPYTARRKKIIFSGLRFRIKNKKQ
jgi:hypothetical protein